MIALILSSCQITIPFDEAQEDTGSAAGDTGVLDTADSGQAGTDAGTLATEWPLAEGDDCRWVWAEDVTGDGREDIVYASSPLTSWGERGRPFELHVIVNQGGDRFGAPQAFMLGHNENYYIDAAFADLNEDGIQDIVIGHLDGFSVFFGAADGALDGPHDTDAAEALGLAVGDVDADGHVDVAVCSEPNQFLVWRGDGAGGLVRGGTGTACTAEDLSWDPPRSTLVDLDGDGNLDYLRRLAFGAALEVVWNDGGTFGNATIYQPPASILSADHPMEDFAIVRLPQFATPLVAVAAFNEPTQWMFDFTQRELGMATGYGMLDATNPVQLIVDDADGDGLDDLVTPYRLLGDRAEAGVWLSSDLGGGSWNQEYYPGEWEMTGVYAETTEHGFDLINLDREGLSPLVVTTLDSAGLWSVRIVEAESTL